MIVFRKSPTPKKRGVLRIELSDWDVKLLHYEYKSKSLPVYTYDLAWVYWLL
jgi:hypothetical protein